MMKLTPEDPIHLFSYIHKIVYKLHFLVEIE